MPKAKNAKPGGKGKVYAMPSSQKKKDGGIPKFNTSKLIGKQAMPYGKSKVIASNGVPVIPTINGLASTSSLYTDPEAGPSETYAPIDASLSIRDSSSKAFMRELRKVIERSDVIIQVLDARDPEGTRSRWVEEEVRKRESEGKKLLAVVNKIDLVPRANLEAWLRHLRHSFPTMPFKSSTQSQRGNLSQNAVPLAQAPTSGLGQSGSLPALPTTSSSLGAPALLHLLKQYALSTPHSALTVGVVGYPNVGKSSLINSLKRSRACAVAAMPGKTRVTQEVVLDKGVKIVDCPGVVLEDIGKNMEGEEGRRKQAELMLRNCIKAELVEDPTAPVEVILSKTDPALLQKLYNIPPYDDVRDFLIKIALTRGRLGKGGIPDLEGSAVSVLRDWNSGRIAYFTTPPVHHPSTVTVPASSGDVEMGGEEKQAGGDKILTQLSEAFTLEGLFDQVGEDSGALMDEVDNAGEDVMVEDETLPSAVAILPPTTTPAIFGQAIASVPNTFMPLPKPPQADTNKLFTPEELAMLPPEMLDRQKAKLAAKKAKKRKAAADETEDQLMFGFLGMGMEEPEPLEPEGPAKLTRKEKKRVKWLERKAAQAAMQSDVVQLDDVDVNPEDEERRKEEDFAKFLANVGGDSDMEL